MIHPIVRAGIRAELERLPEVEVVAEVNDGREAWKPSSRGDRTLFSWTFPWPAQRFKATARIAREIPKVRVVILSRHEEEEYYWHALKAGASGYLLKRATTAEIQTALHRVIEGEIFLSQEISIRLRQKLPLQRITSAKSPVEELTGGAEILQLIAEGQTTKAIALILKLNPKTVEYHRAQLMQRLNIYDIPGLVRFALRTGLISQES